MSTRVSLGHAVVLSPGPWQPHGELPDGVDAIGFIVTDGLISRDLRLASGVASDLLGPGDFAGLDADAEDAFLPLRTRWVVCATKTQVTYLDQALMATLRQRPEISARLLARAAQQANRQAAHRALSQLPRVDLRLLSLLWLLAERWGRVGTQGIVVPVALTHEALGRMVGARRPTVSLALKRLDRQGAVHRRDDGAWVLSPDSTIRLQPDDRGSISAPAPEAILTEAPPESGDGTTSMSAPPAAGTILTTEQLAQRVEELVDEHAGSRVRMQELIARSKTTRRQEANSAEHRAAGSTKPEEKA